MTPSEPAAGGQDQPAAARPAHLPARVWLRAASAGMMGGLVGLLLDFLWPCKAHEGRH